MLEKEKGMLGFSWLYVECSDLVAYGKLTVAVSGFLDKGKYPVAIIILSYQVKCREMKDLESTDSIWKNEYKILKL